MEKAYKFLSDVTNGFRWEYVWRLTKIAGIELIKQLFLCCHDSRPTIWEDQTVDY